MNWKKISKKIFPPVWMKSKMKKWIFFGVQTYVKPNLVFSEISEMKRWKVRWRNEEMKKKIFGSEHMSSQIWCYLKLVRWRDEEWDEEIKMKKNFLSEHTYYLFLVAMDSYGPHESPCATIVYILNSYWGIRV